ncbi:ATP-binding protein [Sphingomonas sp. ASY06-1R]|uniref:ATP-binding protein n=1 Tax=Sphingomonas sp. ASY06-1R TaxID=3445771 RepID=UPI003FA1B215
MKQIEVRVENDHIQRITTARPLAAISELIWNAYDADATEVRVELEKGQLTTLGGIHIIDNGTGIPLDTIEDSFQKLGGSWKRPGRKTTGGRAVHGEKGQGRFKAFSLGDSVAWTSNYGGQRFTIFGQKSNLKNFEVSEPVATSSQGCAVAIRDVIKDFEIWAENGFADGVRDVFALQLYDDPSFQIIYDGVAVDAREAIDSVTPYPIAVDQGGRTFDAILDVVEWKKSVDRKLMLCLPGRFSFYEMPPGIQARGFEFTAYLTAEHFQQLADNHAEGLVELDPTSNALIEAAKARLREHFRTKEAARSRDKIQEWVEAAIYPYDGAAADPIEINERQLFDVVALNLADYSPDFDKSPPKQKKLVLQLIKAAIETGATNLLSILEKVIDLPKERQAELADLLRKTSLTAVINAAKAVTDRLDFLKALQLLVFEPQSRRQLLERSQLHRIIAQETWIFGEHFNLVNDDQDLTSVLRSHIELLGAERELPGAAEPVLDAEGKAAIVDLMLSARVPTPTDDERRHLVVELKRPLQPLNEDVLGQIRKYAKAVALDPRFKHSNVEWDFVAISNKFTPDAELEARLAGKPRGLIMELDDPIKIRVWAKTWGQIIQEAEGRLTFYKRRLEYQASDEEALGYLRTIDNAYLSEAVKARIAEMDGDEADEEPKSES